MEKRFSLFVFSW